MHRYILRIIYRYPQNHKLLDTLHSVSFFKKHHQYTCNNLPWFYLLWHDSFTKKLRTVIKFYATKSVIDPNVTNSIKNTMLEEAVNHNKSQNNSTNSKKTKINLKLLRNDTKKTVKIQSKTNNLSNESNETDLEQKNKGEKRPINTVNSDVIECKGKIRAVVNLEMMKEELKQLEDLPLTPWEKEISASKLEYSFFDASCENLAQHLLGKVLVRRLENGTILKGRIVETEGYLGVIDKASHTYQNKITPRNIPMYMPPGTIYVYMTYGMYHCFNISSQESGGYVLIRAVEPLLGLEYMELLTNMQVKENKKEKEIKTNIKQFKPSELCNSPFKICTSFVIEEEEFNNKSIHNNNNLWLEHDLSAESTAVVAAPCIEVDSYCNNESIKLLRYYILGNCCVSQRDMQYEEKILGDGCAVLIRGIDPLEGIECMTENRNSKAKSKSKNNKNYKTHELCNGPSKLCMAFQLQKNHSKYSICNWRGLWIENDPTKEEIKIIKSTRIGIDSCGPEWANKPLRFYIYGNKSVSKRDKKAESLLEIK